MSALQSTEDLLISYFIRVSLVVTLRIVYVLGRYLH